MGEKLSTKTDTSENWAKAKNFIPKKGELIFYSDTGQIKIGNGADYVNDLKFIGPQIETEYDEQDMQLTISWE